MRIWLHLNISKKKGKKYILILDLLIASAKKHKLAIYLLIVSAKKHWSMLGLILQKKKKKNISKEVVVNWRLGSQLIR